MSLGTLSDHLRAELQASFGEVPPKGAQGADAEMLARIREEVDWTPAEVDQLHARVYRGPVYRWLEARILSNPSIYPGGLKRARQILQAQHETLLQQPYRDEDEGALSEALMALFELWVAIDVALRLGMPDPDGLTAGSEAGAMGRAAAAADQLADEQTGGSQMVRALRRYLQSVRAAQDAAEAGSDLRDFLIERFGQEGGDLTFDEITDHVLLTGAVRRQLVEPANLAKWLRRAGGREARRARKRGTVEVSIGEEHDLTLPDGVEDEEQDERLLRAFLLTLPDRMRQDVELAAAGLRPADIARQTARSKPTVHESLKAAEGRFRRFLRARP